MDSNKAQPMTPCMPCSFGLLPHPRSGTGAHTNGLLRVTVSVRYIPLVTAAYGTRVARPARMTVAIPGSDPSNSTVRCASSPVTTASLPEPEGSRTEVS